MVPDALGNRRLAGGIEVVAFGGDRIGGLVAKVPEIGEQEGIVSGAQIGFEVAQVGVGGAGEAHGGVRALAETVAEEHGAGRGARDPDCRVGGAPVVIAGQRAPLVT